VSRWGPLWADGHGASHNYRIAALGSPSDTAARLPPQRQELSVLDHPLSLADAKDISGDSAPATQIAPDTSGRQFFADDLPARGATLKVRVSLLITALLAIVTLVGGIYVVHKARDDIQAEVRSTLTLTDHFLDAQLDVLRDRWSSGVQTTPLFQLEKLRDIRHLKVQFYDNHDRLLESNAGAANHPAIAPGWFAALIRVASPPMLPETRTIALNGATVGRLVIAPDPTSETDEIWATSRALLGLLLLFFVLVNGFVWWAVARAMRPVEQILAALGELRRGNLAVRLPPFAVPEMARISVGFNHLAETLQRSVTENRRLTRQLLRTQENERTILARELHDEIGQCVSAMHADAVAIRNRGGEAVRESAEAIVAVAGQIKEIVRSMLQRLRPPALEGLGLTAALRELVTAFQQRNPEVKCSLKSGSEPLPLDHETGIAVYRVVQECLTNIALHAHAQQVVIEIASPAPGRIRVTVADDGVGFFSPPAKRGFGLRGIRERVGALGGTYDIDSHPGRGTRIWFEVPLSADPEEAL